jgi:endonuclease/exonuclease/phosphatase (EEP) superfamily protein YafD
VGLPALLLTWTRLVDSDVGTLIRLESFTPIGIPLYVGALLLMVSGALVAEQRSRRVVGAVLALAGLLLHLWWFAPQVTGDVPPPAAGAEALTIMNSNMFAGAADADDIVDAVRADGVDVLVAEEITPDAVARLEAAGLSELLPYSAGSPTPDVAGTMVFASTPITDVQQLATTFGSYRVSVAGLTVLAVHPLAPTVPAGWVREHALILDEAERSQADVIVGDLNATPDHDVLRDLDAAGWRDAGEVANVGWQPTWPANHLGVLPLLPPVVRIDHVLIDDQLTSLGTHSVDVAGTDHLALVAEIAPRG